MKIYTSVTINMDTGETVEEESYEYVGNVAVCKSGGAGGGSPAGSLAYPAYMQEAHANWLNGGTGASGGARDQLSVSVVAAMNTAMLGDSPFHGFPIVNVDTVFLGQYKNVSSYMSPYERLAELGCLNIDGAFDDYITDDNARISAILAAQSDELDNEVMTKIMPRLHAGMVDINAVQSSSFLLAESLIWGQKIQALAKSDASVRLERLASQSDMAIKRIGTKLEWARLTGALAAELARMYTAARHDLDGFSAEIAAKDKLFDLSIFQYGTNIMSSIHGSAVSPPDPGSGKTGTGGALSGALMGAAIGAQVGGVYGALGGAVLGGVAGLIQ